MEWINEVFEEERPYNIKHRSYFFARDVVLFVKGCKYERIMSSLFDQVIRSSTSIGANIVEGLAGSSKKDWLKFMNISLKSANETKFWLCLIRDTGGEGIDKKKVTDLLKEATELSKIIARIMINTKLNDKNEINRSKTK